MKPIHIKGMKRSNVWKPARRVWFQKNDDRSRARDTVRQRNKEEILGPIMAREDYKRLIRDEGQKFADESFPDIIKEERSSAIDEVRRGIFEDEDD
jgi:hypothetical protein